MYVVTFDPYVPCSYWDQLSVSSNTLPLFVYSLIRRPGSPAAVRWVQCGLKGQYAAVEGQSPADSRRVIVYPRPASGEEWR